eukprot:TRINITY_DN144_c0_g1_i1.p1 TRINITY_DN144_c0_g1~~TRINITY_DN144_c0_g1_i1.p1  ORF type:complete len:467 (-),score=96.68 TRINITY_DN144_c0_g1_i1:90-1490(-)
MTPNPSSVLLGVAYVVDLYYRGHLVGFDPSSANFFDEDGQAKYGDFGDVSIELDEMSRKLRLKKETARVSALLRGLFGIPTKRKFFQFLRDAGFDPHVAEQAQNFVEGSLFAPDFLKEFRDVLAASFAACQIVERRDVALVYYAGLYAKYQALLDGDFSILTPKPHVAPTEKDNKECLITLEQKAITEREVTRRLLQEKEDGIESLQKLIRLLEKRLHEASDARSKAEEVSDQLLKEKHVAEARSADLEARLADFEARSADLEARLATLEARNAQLEAELQAALPPTKISEPQGDVKISKWSLQAGELVSDGFATACAKVLMKLKIHAQNRAGSFDITVPRQPMNDAKDDKEIVEQTFVVDGKPQTLKDMVGSLKGPNGYHPKITLRLCAALVVWSNGSCKVISSPWNKGFTASLKSGPLDTAEEKPACAIEEKRKEKKGQGRLWLAHISFFDAKVIQLLKNNDVK